MEKIFDPDFGDKMVGYTCLIGIGFIIGMLAFGG